ncbi:MAG TPA: DUF4831 family protein, partial [Bacteroidales bacterium]|nr:DUF4831 family protein [Bacteroidales bacterium]
MKRTITIISIAILVLLAQSCVTTSSFQVTKLGDEPDESAGKIVYVLPQTLLYVTVDFEKETYIPGPYRIFTQKYLGMKPYVNEPGFSYRITNVDVHTDEEPDGSQFYSINILEGHPDFDKYLSLGKEGLVLDPSQLYNFSTHSEKAGNPPESP